MLSYLYGDFHFDFGRFEGVEGRSGDGMQVDEEIEPGLASKQRQQVHADLTQRRPCLVFPFLVFRKNLDHRD